MTTFNPNLSQAATELARELREAEAWERYLEAKRLPLKTEYKMWREPTKYRYIMNGHLDVTDYIMNDVEVPNARFFEIEVVENV